MRTWRTRFAEEGVEAIDKIAPGRGSGTPPVERTPDLPGLPLAEGSPPWDDIAGSSRRSSSVMQ